jgi:CheY-like chemotaxis protein
VICDFIKFEPALGLAYPEPFKPQWDGITAAVRSPMKLENVIVGQMRGLTAELRTGPCANRGFGSTACQRYILCCRHTIPMPMLSKNVTVLIVDDDPLHLTLYTWILQSDGYKCATALVKGTSVELPSEAAIDLVLLDYRLSSSLTSLDVIHRLRSTFAPVPIVILSELQWMPDDVRDHAVAFVNKGDPRRLLETIAAVLPSKSA